MRQKNLVFLIICLVLLMVVSIPFGVLFSDFVPGRISVLYSTEFTIAEDVTLQGNDDYDTLVLTKGLTGSITDGVDSRLGDDAGERYMHACIGLNDGTSITLFIDTDTTVNDRQGSVIGIDKIENAEKILSEYKASREECRSKALIKRMVCCAVSFLISVSVSCIFLRIYYKQRKENVASISLVVIALTVDMMLIVLCLLLNVVNSRVL